MNEGEAVAIGVALIVSFAAGVIGLFYSIFDAIHLAGKSESGRATWHPVPFVLAFGLFWPALLLLFPFVIFHAVIERARRADKAWAHVLHGSNGYLMLVRFLQGLGFGIMLSYVGYLVL